VYRGAEFGGFLFQQIFQPFGHRAAENRLAVFRTPNQVVFERENRAGVPSVTSVYHRKCLNTLLDTLQLNNVEFGEGIASRTRRCEIPLSAISRQSPFAKLMERYAKAAGIKASCHSLRHTFASNLLEEGAEIVSIKELMGHSSIESSERYAKLSNQRVKRVYLQTIKKVIDKTRV